MDELFPMTMTNLPNESPEQITNPLKSWPLQLGWKAWFLREMVSVAFWTYAVVKLFVFDIDRLVIKSSFPEYIWVSDYKLLFILSIVFVTFCMTKTKTASIWFAYILFYPIIMLCFKFPYLLFRKGSWSLAIACANAIASFLKSFRRNIIILSGYALCLGLLVISRDEFVVYASSLTMLLFLFSIYFSQFISVFKPDTIFQFYRRRIEKFRTQTVFPLESELKNTPVEYMTENQVSKWTQRLEATVLINRAYLFSAKKMEEYQSSGAGLISGVFIVIFLIFLTVVTFAVVNYGFSRIPYQHYEFNGSKNLFEFFYYSFNLFIFNSIPSITPVSNLSKTLAMTQWAFTLLLLAIFISLTISVRTKRYQEELQEFIVLLQDEGQAMEEYVSAEYDFSNIREALSALEKLESSMSGFLLYISKHLD